MITYYEVLDVKNDATASEIRKSYNRLARTHHPDVAQDGGKFFTLVNEAYRILGNESLRTDYDAGLLHGHGSNGNFSGSSNNQSSNASSSKQGTYDSGSYQQESPTGYTFDDVEQVRVDWNNYSWFDKIRNLDYPVKVVNPKPYLYSSVIFSTLYVSFAILSALTLVFARHEGYFFSLALAVAQLFSMRVWVSSKGQGLSNKLIIFHSIVTLINTWFFVTHSYGGLATFFLIVFNLGYLSMAVLSSVYLYHSRMEKNHLGFRGSHDLKPKDAMQYTTWGKVADLEGAIAKFGRRNVEMGIVGERYTDDLTRMFLNIPGVRRFNGLRFPQSKTADVDHALVYNDIVIFIDSKQWAQGNYEWVNQNQVHRTYGDRGQHHQDRTIHFTNAVRAYRNKLPARCKVYGLILVHGRGIVVNEERNMCDNVYLANTETGMDYIGQILTDAEPEVKGKIDHKVMNILGHNLK